MKQIIDIETWERRDNYNFSATLLAPGIPLLQRLIVQRQVWLPEQRDALFPLLSLCRAPFGKRGG